MFWVTASNVALQEPASAAYALDVGAMILLQGALTHFLLAEGRVAPRKGIRPTQLERIRRRMRSAFAAGLLFLTSSLPIFWIPTLGNSMLRIDLWYAG